MSNSSRNGGNSGRRPFFNDRRITVAGPQRLRQNVQDLLSQFNRQFVADNPHLLHELADQLNRLQELLSSNANGANNAAETQQNNEAVAAPTTGAPQQIRLPVGRLAGRESDPGPSNSPTDLLSEFENNINRLANNGTQLSANESDRNDRAATGEGNYASEIPPTDSVVLNMEIDTDGNIHVDGRAPTATDQVAIAQAQQPQQAAGEDATINADADWQRLIATLRAPEMQRICRMVMNFGPFVFILLIKWMLTYAASIVMLFCLIATFFYSENAVESAVASSRTQQTPKCRLLSTVIMLALNIGGLYYFFSTDELYLALLLQPTEPLRDSAMRVSFLELLWLVITTDFVAKFIFMIAKCLVVAGSTIGDSRRRKARTYQWLEYTSHMYRHWLPTVPWSCYLTTVKTSGIVRSGLCTILFMLYIILKIKLFRPKLTRWWQSTVNLLRPSALGHSPSTVELMTTGPTCSICYADFTNPVQLACKHIFCEECVTTWLDKQKTCPMCRTQVVTGDNEWKDGKTSYCLQLV